MNFQFLKLSNKIKKRFMTVDENFNTRMLSDQRINFFQQCDMNFYIFKMSRKKQLP